MRHDHEWMQIDTCIISWLYTTLSTDLLNVIIQPDHDALSAWTAICNQFLDNAVQRSVHLRQELHALHQADMSITAYCGRLKELADNLRELGSPLSNPDLVVILLSGLNDKFASCISTISASNPRHDLSAGAVLPSSGGSLDRHPGTEGGVHCHARRRAVRWCPVQRTHH